ncbi:hypothetical protein U2H31_003684 [Pseudomonas aeruginosa]|nr:hypothetical protein [Pseudomonas aeruginosa]
MELLQYRTGELRYPDDVDRMSSILASEGYLASARDLEALWEAYSAKEGSSWAFLPDTDADLLALLLDGFEVHHCQNCSPGFD